MQATDQAATTRRSLLNFRASATEREQLQRMAIDRGISLSDLIRQGLQSQGFEPQR